MTDTAFPSAQLAEKVFDRLVTVGLLRADKRDVLISKIASGTISGADWKLEIDLASAKAAQQ